MKNFYLYDMMHHKYVKHVKDGLITLTDDMREVDLFSIADVWELLDKLSQEYGPHFSAGCIDNLIEQQKKAREEFLNGTV